MRRAHHGGARDPRDRSQPPAAPVAPLRADGWLEVDDLTFCYPGAAAPVLRDISFTARPGQTTAIIGSTGAGKTTLLR